MGSFIEINDTLRITKEQGFPEELDLEKHLKNPYKTEVFADKEFEFKDKPKVRIYKIPPVRNFLVEDKDGKWVYWGLCLVTEVRHNNLTETTSGKFKIIKIFTPDEMKKAEFIAHTESETRYFAKR